MSLLSSLYLVGSLFKSILHAKTWTLLGALDFHRRDKAREIGNSN